MSTEKVDPVRDAHQSAIWLMEVIQDVALSCDPKPGLNEDQNWTRCILEGLNAIHRMSDWQFGIANVEKNLDVFSALRSEPFRLGKSSYASAHHAIVLVARQILHDIIRAGMSRLWKRVISHIPEDADIEGGDGYNYFLITAAVETRILKSELSKDYRKSLNEVFPGFYKSLNEDMQFDSEVNVIRNGHYESHEWSELISVSIPKSKSHGLHNRLKRTLAEIDLSEFLAVLRIEGSKARPKDQFSTVQGVPGGPTRLHIDLIRNVIALDGNLYGVTADQARIVGVLWDKSPGWVSSKEMKTSPQTEERPDRIIRRLPNPIRELIEAKTGAGYRLAVR